MNPLPLRLKPFSAVVFDMDGTLLDTELVFKEIVFDVTRSLGFEMREEVHFAMVGASHEASNALLVEAYGVSFPYHLFDQQCGDAMRLRMAKAVPLKTGVVEMLDELKHRGLPMAVATSSRRRAVDVNLTAAGIIDLFDTIVTRDDVEQPKPHPEPYLTAASRLGFAPAECLAIEDSHSGVRAAHAAGMQTVMVPDLVRPTDEITALCAAVMESLHHVREAAFGLQNA